MKQFARVISVRHDCAVKPARHPREPLAAYATRLQSHLLEHLHEAVAVALYAAHAEQGEPDARRRPVTFVSAPEFYWSVPWHALHDLREVRQLPALQIDPVCEAIAEVAARFPVEHVGRIVFLPGTVALLIDVRRPPGRRASAAVAALGGALLEPLNCLYATANFPPPFASGADAQPRRALAWPKRHTSRIDYGRQKHALETPYSRTFELADGSFIEVLKESDVALQRATAAHARGTRLSDRLGDVPAFGIDLCRDFLQGRGEPPPGFDTAHPDEPRCVIDFVPSYGATVTDVAFPVPRSLQYIAHNDGHAARQVAVFEVDRTRLRWTRVAPAACMRHLGADARERVAIHEFTVDVPAPGGAQ
ncbi:hypothetical protein [Burkholderia ubonensis]|uniref:Uncharacterized protein n=1 Tax=Burkholderia ubonensis TaxID=101571 RepID=A0A107FWA9_9BURK|nr:hypothetical protein [Burkholderia ubonensis]KWD76476.1 hypothetical protein WL71_29610 [Burkholderia ubonensis]KWD77193.1 hypothetical protein WL70_23065 [Burkholderia ubonensis]KWD90089.1 hypothetical protein WL72_31395 [Burkholderia ubonensis]KWE00848.1 hypothetical protein WL73_17880 [Burkholderia ubonensis]